MDRKITARAIVVILVILMLLLLVLVAPSCIDRAKKDEPALIGNEPVGCVGVGIGRNEFTNNNGAFTKVAMVENKTSTVPWYVPERIGRSKHSSSSSEAFQPEPAIETEEKITPEIEPLAKEYVSEPSNTALIGQIVPAKEDVDNPSKPIGEAISKPVVVSTETTTAEAKIAKGVVGEKIDAPVSPEPISEPASEIGREIANVPISDQQPTTPASDGTTAPETETSEQSANETSAPAPPESKTFVLPDFCCEATKRAVNLRGEVPKTANLQGGKPGIYHTEGEKPDTYHIGQK